MSFHANSWLVSRRTLRERSGQRPRDSTHFGTWHTHALFHRPFILPFVARGWSLTSVSVLRYLHYYILLMTGVESVVIPHQSWAPILVHKCPSVTIYKKSRLMDVPSDRCFYSLSLLLSMRSLVVYQVFYSYLYPYKSRSHTWSKLLFINFYISVQYLHYLHFCESRWIVKRSFSHLSMTLFCFILLMPFREKLLQGRRNLLGCKCSLTFFFRYIHNFGNQYGFEKDS